MSPEYAREVIGASTLRSPMTFHKDDPIKEWRLKNVLQWRSNMRARFSKCSLIAEVVCCSAATCVHDPSEDFPRTCPSRVSRRRYCILGRLALSLS